MEVRAYREDDLPAMAEIWNEVVEEGVAFPQTERLSLGDARELFAQQSLSAVAEEDGEILGLYILHPNNVGRCAHIANAIYAVSSRCRGLSVGEALVRHCLRRAAAGFASCSSRPSSKRTRARYGSTSGSGSGGSARCPADS